MKDEFYLDQMEIEKEGELMTVGNLKCAQYTDHHFLSITSFNHKNISYAYDFLFTSEENKVNIKSIKRNIYKANLCYHVLHAVKNGSGTERQ